MIKRFSSLLKSAFLFWIIFQMVSKPSYGQASVYHLFPDSGVVWNLYSTGQCSVAVSDNQWYSIVISGDTVIGAANYHKLSIPWIIDTNNCWQSNGGYPGYYLGAIRLDTSARTVYFIDRNTSYEWLLYDFSMHTGDTIRGYLMSVGCSDDSTVLAEDSVLIGSSYRKRWKTHVIYGPEYIIEGIGYLGGLLNPICSWFEGGTILTCFSQDNNVLYVDSFFNPLSPGSILLNLIIIFPVAIFFQIQFIPQLQ
jgi:hypothetical protein